MYNYFWGDLMKENLEKIVKILKDGQKTISTMESCTGGAIVNAITNVPGASSVLNFSAVTYSNDFKIKMGVSRDIIDTYTVYSMETALSMAKAICKFTQSNYGIGVTGKLGKKDPNNEFGEDNQVFISIYDSDRNIDMSFDVFVDSSDRRDDKKEVLDVLVLKFLEFLSK